MKERIRKRLNEAINEEEKELLRDILEEVFLNLYEYSEQQYIDLEKKVFEEVDNSKQVYYIYTSLAQRKEYDITDHFLFPIHSSDLEEKKYNFNEIKECLQKEERFFVFPIFMECDYLLIKKILQNKKYWKGSILTDRKYYEAYFEIEQDTSYEKEIEELYNIFIENMIPWNPINIPYIHKIIQVFLIGCEDGFLEKEEIQEIRVDFGEYARYIKRDIVPLWNIQSAKIKTTGFAYPVGEAKRYEHKISLMQEGIEHGYLINSFYSPFYSVRRSKDYLYLVAKTEESMVWDIKKIINPIVKEQNYYPIITNAKKDCFAERYAKKVQLPIRTKIEIERVFSSLEATKELILEEIFFTEKEEEGETYCLEPFLKDEIRGGRKKEKMIFVFHEKVSSYLSRDIISFFLAQIQCYFPEYDCEGKLV